MTVALRPSHPMVWFLRVAPNTEVSFHIIFYCYTTCISLSSWLGQRQTHLQQICAAACDRRECVHLVWVVCVRWGRRCCRRTESPWASRAAEFGPAPAVLTRDWQCWNPQSSWPETLTHWSPSQLQENTNGWWLMTTIWGFIVNEWVEKFKWI